ncbi:MAG: helix-turn-helix domain-containing protein [Eubacterium sp.]|nr:helix-turn-helix domain-containing protein [Eubacterium sp.]
MNIGENIQRLRIKANLTQSQLADYIGVSQSAVYYWEKGKREPNTETILKLLNIFHITLDELYGIEIDPTEREFSIVCEWLEEAGFSIDPPDQDDALQQYYINSFNHSTICKMDRVDIIETIQPLINKANEIRDDILIGYIRKTIIDEY